jgi:hypothetical protein
MEILAEARSHFDASVSGPVLYSATPVHDKGTDEVWTQEAVRSAHCLTEKGTYSRYGDLIEFSPSWLENLTVEDHEGIAVFVTKHKESFWAIDGLWETLRHQCMSSNPSYAYLLRNFLLLWDETTTHTFEESSEDCYSLHAISGLGGVDISALPAEDQVRYRALAGFAVDAYLANFYGRGHGPHPSGAPFVVDEIVYPGDYKVQEPYRSMVWEHPEQAVPLIEYLKRGYVGDELAALLAESTPAAMSAGVL